ncbi:MAG: MarR family transcriptional regulator [Candidatus Bathyarchaeota archaeon]|nr:MarR family transcriptional regulator [Candidatus Bathyarchaeota archaeon]
MEITILIIYTIIFCVSSVFLLAYFRKMRCEILKNKDMKKLFEDIVFSFNKDLQKIERRLQEVADNYGKISADRWKELDSLISDFKERIENLTKHTETMAAEHRVLKERIEDLVAKYNDLLERISRIERERDLDKIRKEPDADNLSRLFPVEDKSKVLTSLTETELKVLEILAEEGEKTVSEIKARIGLTREHTARLMKSLYVRGYVERREDRAPYVYRLKREMESILKKGESSP